MTNILRFYPPGIQRPSSNPSFVGRSCRIASCVAFILALASDRPIEFLGLSSDQYTLDNHALSDCIDNTKGYMNRPTIATSFQCTVDNIPITVVYNQEQNQYYFRKSQ